LLSTGGRGILPGRFRPFDPSLPQGDGRGVILIPGLLGRRHSAFRAAKKIADPRLRRTDVGPRNRPRWEARHRNGRSRTAIIRQARACAAPSGIAWIAWSPVARRSSIAAFSERARARAISVSRALFAQRPECMSGRCGHDFIRRRNGLLLKPVRSCARDGVAKLEWLRRINARGQTSRARTSAEVTWARSRVRWR